LTLRIRQFTVFEFFVARYRHHAAPNDTTRNADNCRVVRNRLDDNRAGAYFHVISQGDITEDFRARTNDNVVASSRVPLALLFSRSAKRNPLINQAIVTDLGSFAYDYASTMVNEEAAADAGTGVNLDLSQKAVELRNDAGQNRDIQFVKPVREPVKQNGVKAGIAQKDFDEAAGRRIPLFDGADLLAYGAEHRSHYLIVDAADRLCDGTI